MNEVCQEHSGFEARLSNVEVEVNLLKKRLFQIIMLLLMNLGGIITIFVQLISGWKGG